MVGFKLWSLFLGQGRNTFEQRCYLTSACMSIEGLQHCPRMNAHQLFKIVNLFRMVPLRDTGGPIQHFWHTESKVLHLDGSVFGRDTKRLGKSLPLKIQLKIIEIKLSFSQYFKIEQTTDLISCDKYACWWFKPNFRQSSWRNKNATQILH